MENWKGKKHYLIYFIFSVIVFLHLFPIQNYLFQFKTFYLWIKKIIWFTFVRSILFAYSVYSMHHSRRHRQHFYYFLRIFFLHSAPIVRYLLCPTLFQDHCKHFDHFRFRSTSFDLNSRNERRTKKIERKSFSLKSEQKN